MKGIIFYLLIVFDNLVFQDAVIAIPPYPAMTGSRRKSIQAAILEGHPLGETVIEFPVSSGLLCKITFFISLKKAPGIAFDAPVSIDDTSHIDAGLVVVIDVIDVHTAFVTTLQMQSRYCSRIYRFAGPFAVPESIDDSHRVIVRERIDVVDLCNVYSLQNLVLIFRKSDRLIAEPLAGRSLGYRGRKCIEVENPLQNKVIPEIARLGETLLQLAGKDSELTSGHPFSIFGVVMCGIFPEDIIF